MHQRCKRLVSIPAVVAVMLPAVGCATGPRISPDIVKVSTFYVAAPWLNFEIARPDVPGGLKFALYLKPARYEKGAFGDGVIHVEMYRVDRAAGGQKDQTLVHRWSFDVDQAHPYRFSTEKRVGWGYGMRLNWEDADVLGREIMMVALFERRDGSIVRGRPKYFVVPERV